MPGDRTLRSQQEGLSGAYERFLSRNDVTPGLRGFPFLGVADGKNKGERDTEN